MTSRPVTPSQTVGPFFHDCLLRADARRDTIVGDSGDAQIRVEGRVLDGDGAAVPDAVIEVWHAAGFARVGTDEDGRFSLTTVRPERAPYDRSTMQAPHLSVAVFARGLMNHLFTRIYSRMSHRPRATPSSATCPKRGGRRSSRKRLPTRT
jgi:protocatechuate 3,4-dioxygenase alpha subunit